MLRRVAAATSIQLSYGCVGSGYDGAAAEMEVHIGNRRGMRVGARVVRLLLHRQRRRAKAGRSVGAIRGCCRRY
jgi:hypothetical protein